MALIASVPLLPTNLAFAYPTFIGYGYTSCQVCHFNAFGNGPLTDYGRALGATAISARGPFAGKTSEEDLAAAAGFLGSTKLPVWLRPSVGVRGLLFNDEMQSSSARKRMIPMQLDAALTIQSTDRRHWANVSVGYLPYRGFATKDAAKRKPLISREHYIAARLGPNRRIMIGMMDIPFGIRIPDHTAYSRGATLLKQNDQAHQVTLHQYGENYELGISAIAGNMFQDSQLRQHGASVLAEYDLYEKVRIGHSHLYTTNKFRSRLMNAVHARIGAGEGSASLFELGLVRERTQIPTTELRGYFLFENTVRVSRGFHVLVLGEFLSPDILNSSPRSLRIGPALQIFPMNRVEWRTDFQITRTLNANTVEKDSLDFLTQIHLWF